jgi:hypothetical protein
VNSFLEDLEMPQWDETLNKSIPVAVRRTKMKGKCSQSQDNARERPKKAQRRVCLWWTARP